MAFFQEMKETIIDLFRPISETNLSDFQKRKIEHEFTMFFDTNKDGDIQWKDFVIAKKNICKLSGWTADGDKADKYKHMQEIFALLWRNLSDTGDENVDGKISGEEWERMWTDIYKAKLQYDKATVKYEATDTPMAEKEPTYLPTWFESYIEYKFNLYDRTGDGVIDAEEFEYTLVDGFGMPVKDARSAFRMFSEGGDKKIDLQYFRELAIQYYLSDDPGALGNFINGKLTYE